MPDVKRLKTITVRKDGTIEFIYDDDLKGFIDDNKEKKVFRASHVEPNENGDWYADLSPINGPKLTGFKTRQAALNAEVAWIQNNYLRQNNENISVRVDEGSQQEQGSV